MIICLLFDCPQVDEEMRVLLQNLKDMVEAERAAKLGKKGKKKKGKKKVRGGGALLRAFGGSGGGVRCKDRVQAERAVTLGKKGRKEKGKKKARGGSVFGKCVWGGTRTR